MALLVTVVKNGETYTTNTVRGQRGRSILCAEAAACRLGRRLLGAQFAGAQRVIDPPDGPYGLTTWELLEKEAEE